jgi:16S rRNA processing protein RimM
LTSSKKTNKASHARVEEQTLETGLTPPGTPDSWVWLARIRRTQGRKGEVFAEILTDFPEKFAERRRLWLLSDTASAGSRLHPPESQPGAPRSALPSTREVELKNHWLHKGGIVLHFAGVDSISDAEQLASLVVAVPRSERVPLSEDEVYIGDLIGCTLFDVAPPSGPVVVGQIEDVERAAGTSPMLIIQGASGEVLIPFAKIYLRKVDLDARRVEMALPEGLTDLNV